MAHRIGAHSILFDHPLSIPASAAVGSKKESEGPLAQAFDVINPDSYFGQKSWEKAESELQTIAVNTALQKAGWKNTDVDCVFAGDLLNQCIGSTYGLRALGIPFVGLFGACSTMAESLCVASTFLDAGAIQKGVACTSSHFCTAERQFRYPLEYGGQRPPTAQWTATASGAALLEMGETPPFVRGITVGTIEDLGITDANNMGAAMAPAAAATIGRFFQDTKTKPEQFDLILTGDLGKVGSALLHDLLLRDKIDLGDRHNDCGLLLYDSEKQDVHAGGSGCGCAASVLCGHILPQLRNGTLSHVLFIATGALMSPTVVQQGESIASIAHLVYLSNLKEGGPIA
ncbi:MAG: stage V sporulation protein AD [Anaerotruncus sp.]|nr:stage V sporulation protein AD [Anaerotruncus sp.]